jgi:hypothetical protein
MCHIHNCVDLYIHVYQKQMHNHANILACTCVSGTFTRYSVVAARVVVWKATPIFFSGYCPASKTEWLCPSSLLMCLLDVCLVHSTG